MSDRWRTPYCLFQPKADILGGAVLYREKVLGDITGGAGIPCVFARKAIRCADRSPIVRVGTETEEEQPPTDVVESVVTVV